MDMRKSLFLIGKSKMPTRNWQFPMRKSKMLARKSLFLMRKSKILTRKWQFPKRKSEMLARKSLFLMRKSKIRARRYLPVANPRFPSLSSSILVRRCCAAMGASACTGREAGFSRSHFRCETKGQKDSCASVGRYRDRPADELYPFIPMGFFWNMRRQSPMLIQLHF